MDIQSISSVLLFLVSAEPDAIHVSPNFGDGEEGLDDLPQLSIPTETKTVFGYQDFVTTVGNTVMVFTSKGGSYHNIVATRCK